MNPWIDKGTFLTLVPCAFAYGCFHAWKCWKGTFPPLCKMLRYLLGYWIGSTIYISLCIVFPFALSIFVTILYFFPETPYKIKF